MIVSISQPAYLPWLAYFHRLAVSDLHIVLDSVRFSKNSYTNRNRVHTSQGWCWLTVPMKRRVPSDERTIDRLKINNTVRWRDKHWKTLQQNYRKAPCFSDHSIFFSELFKTNWTRLNELCSEVTAYLLDAFGIHIPLQYSSRMGVCGYKNELLLNLCKDVGATTYLAGPLGRDYLCVDLFEKSGIAIEYHDYHQPTYPQLYPPFQPHMAAVDLLFNCGPKSSHILLQKPRAPRP